MTGWDILNEMMKSLPPIVAMLFFLAAGVIFAIGFFRHGVNFVKYGFGQQEMGDLSKKIDGLDTRLSDKITNLDSRLTEKITNLDNRLTEKINGLDSRLTEKINNLDTCLTEKINGLDTRLTEKINGLHDEFHIELEAIKVNHFGYLKNFLSELTSILLDKDIINNTEKTRLDNQLRDM